MVDFASASAAATTTKTPLATLDHIVQIFQQARTRIKVESQELTVRVPELFAQYSVAVDVQQGKFGKFAQKLHFNLPSVESIEVHSLGVSFLPENEAVTQTSNGFELDPTKLSPGTETVLLTFEFRLPDNRFLQNLVHIDSGHDTPEPEDSDTAEYWLVAQLKHPDALRTKFGKLDLRDLGVKVDVGVHQDVKARIPRPFVIQLERIRDFVQTRDRNKALRLAIQHIKGVRYAGKEYELLEDIQELFLPTRFKDFVNVNAPFRYSDCERGTDFYELPVPSFPKTMKVISRTNLGLDQEAAHGTLIYKKKDIRTEIARIFGIKI
jgi:hypothetical protein